MEEADAFIKEACIHLEWWVSVQFVWETENIRSDCSSFSGEDEFEFSTPQIFEFLVRYSAKPVFNFEHVPDVFGKLIVAAKQLSHRSSIQKMLPPDYSLAKRFRTTYR